MDAFFLKVLAVLALHDLKPGDPVTSHLMPSDWIGLEDKVWPTFAALAHAGFLEEKVFVLEQDEDDPSMFNYTHEIPAEEAHRALVTRSRYYATDKIPGFSAIVGSKIVPRGLWLSLGTE